MVVSLEWWLAIVALLGLVPGHPPDRGHPEVAASGPARGVARLRPAPQPLLLPARADAARRPSAWRIGWPARRARPCTSGDGGRGCSSRPCTSPSPWSAAGPATAPGSRPSRSPQAFHELRRTWEQRARAPPRARPPRALERVGRGPRDAARAPARASCGEQGWFPRLDPGWSPKDVRFYGDRWCKLDLTTVTENHGGEKRLTRLRLDTKPTLFQNALLAAA